MKIKCSKCKQIFDSKNFYNNKSRKNGKNAYCKKCCYKSIQQYRKDNNKKVNNNQNNYRSKNRKKINKQNKKYNKKRKEEFKKYYNKNKDKIANRQKLNYKENKFKAINILGGKCLNCNNNDIRVLEFHHDIPNNKKYNISNLLNKKWNIKLEKELNKCILLCANCHRIMHSYTDD